MNAGGRRCARPPGRRHRRGATLVLVVLCMTALLGLSALAIDFARLYTGLNEMQTAADAAALNGALLIQKSPKSNTIEADVTTFAKSYNRALGGPVDTVTVTPYHFETTVNKRKATAWGAADLNAVQVSVQRTSGLLMLARLLNVVFPAPTRTATSWVANFTGNSCVRPWAIEIGRLINRANNSTGVPPKRAISPDEIAKLRALGRAVFVLAPPGSSTATSFYGTNYAGQWSAIKPSNGNYQSAVSSCSSADAIVAGTTWQSAPSTPDPVDASLKGIDPNGNPSPEDVCSELKGSECWKDAELGGPVAMMFGYTTGTDAFAAIDKPHYVDVVASFVLVCYKSSKKIKGVVTAGPCEPTEISTGVPTWKDVPDGTMVGYIDFTPPSFKGKFSLGTGAGTGGATQQRLILVDPTQP
jgi:Flp pilus assembly protein TadG